MPYAHGALCPMPARAPHVTEKGYINSYINREDAEDVINC